MQVADPQNGKQVPLDMDLRELWAKDFGEWSRQECKHGRQELRRGTNNGGAPVIRMQCLDCGRRIGNALKRPSNADELKEFDDALILTYDNARKAAQDKFTQKYVEIQLRRWRGKEDGGSYYAQAHNAYLASTEWKNRRQLVMERAKGVCEGCRQAIPTEVHHLSYAHWGQELLFELVAVCNDCHDRIHAKGDHEALVEGCKTCLHASKGSYCLLFDMPMPMALNPEGPCTFDRDKYEPAE